MSIFIRHEPPGFREYPSKRAQKPAQPLVNVMPEIVLYCALCGRGWGSAEALARHVERGCEREESTP